MDELDVKILRALISESRASPSNAEVRLSLRAIAARIGADDMTVNYRYKRLQKSGALSDWHLILNPSFFGRSVLDVVVDVQPESEKADMIRKLKLVDGAIMILNFFGRALKILTMYSTNESRSRTVELISRITNAERITQSRMPLPLSRTKLLTETDVKIIGALSKDARKSSALVAKELGLSTRTVRNRTDRLRKENTIFTFPSLNIYGIAGLIPVYVSYTYCNGAKSSVDRAMLTHFESSYLWGGFYDPDRGFLMLDAPTIGDVPRILEWAKSQPGIASARIDFPIEQFSYPEKFTELLQLGGEGVALQKNAFL
ncbi:MAG: AsnC family transcriptional regulator [Nitrososphaera sp.]